MKALAALILALAPQAWAIPEKPLHYVSDFAGILEDSVEAGLNARIKGLQASGKAEIAVVTVGSLEGREPKAYANELFKKWGIGQKGKNNGVLILVAPNERKIWIEVGYGLEPILPDGLAGEVIREQFLPAFKRGDYPGGIAAGTERVAQIVEKGEAAPKGSGAGSGADIGERLMLGMFVMIGFLLFGGGVTSGNGDTAIGGFFLGGIPLLISVFLGFHPFLILSIVGAIFFGLGLWMGGLSPSAFRAPSGGGGGGYGGGGGFGGGGGGGSDFGGFGGGSSGGGGAGGSW